MSEHFVCFRCQVTFSEVLMSKIVHNFKVSFFFVYEKKILFRDLFLLPKHKDKLTDITSWVICVLLVLIFFFDSTQTSDFYFKLLNALYPSKDWIYLWVCAFVCVDFSAFKFDLRICCSSPVSSSWPGITTQNKVCIKRIHSWFDCIIQPNDLSKLESLSVVLLGKIC